MIIYFFLIIVIIIIYYILNQNTYIEELDVSVKPKPYMWVYWEIIDKKTEISPYISLCFDIMKRNCSNTFDIKFLDEKNIFDYLRNLRKDINTLPIALKTDYIRVYLLKKYGGIWIDADTIVMTDLREIVDQLNSGIDFIGAGCTGSICKNLDGYGKPSNGVMGSIKDGILITRCFNALNKKLDNYYKTPIQNRKNFDYFELGKKIIWKEYELLKKQYPCYKLYHIPSYSDGTRDSKGNWIALNLIFKDNIKYTNENKLMFIMLANSVYCSNDPKYNWFCKLDRNQILNGNYFISKLFNKALNYYPSKHYIKN